MLIDLIVQKARLEDDSFQKEHRAYENVKVTEGVFDATELHNLSVEGLLFQTGYLTISKIEYVNLTPHYTLNCIYLMGVGFLEKKEKGMQHTKLYIDCELEEWKNERNTTH